MLAVAAIGQRMTATSEKFKTAEPKGLSEVIAVKEIYKEGIMEFENQFKDLKRLEAPIELKQEHNELIEAYRQFVDATQGMSDTLDTVNIKTDSEKFEVEKDKQINASNRIVQISNRIVQKVRM